MVESGPDAFHVAGRHVHGCAGQYPGDVAERPSDVQAIAIDVELLPLDSQAELPGEVPVHAQAEHEVRAVVAGLVLDDVHLDRVGDLVTEAVEDGLSDEVVDLAVQMTAAGAPFPQRRQPVLPGDHLGLRGAPVLEWVTAPENLIFAGPIGTGRGPRLGCGHLPGRVSGPNLRAPGVPMPAATAPA